MWLSEVLSDTHTFNRLYLKDSSFKLHFLNLFFTGFEHPGPTEVPAWTEPASRKRRKGPVTARTFCHRDSSAAAVHPGDQDQEHDLQNQTQAGLHASGLWRKVIMHLHTPSPHSYSFACISDFCEDTAIAPGLKCYIHVVGASYLIELACDHLKIIQLDMDVSCGVYREQCFGLHVQGEDRAGVHGGWTAGTRIWLSVHPRSRHVVLRREPCQK